MQIAVIGATGQIGHDIVLEARAAGASVLPFDHTQVDVTDERSVEEALAALQPGDVVVNTAAFHRTDECEDWPDRAMAVNSVGAFRVAVQAARRTATVVFLSSDFVFDGTKSSPYLESDAGRPLSVYGMTKLAGEDLVARANPAYYIARISSVFGVAGSSGKGGNFVESMLAKARAGESPAVVDDLVMAPTSASDAARLLVQLCVRSAPFGTYHLANAGACSWFEFANAILEESGSAQRATPIRWVREDGKAPRPRYSVLASEKLEALGLRTRPWRDALVEYLTRKGYH
jgi:dTDP-4-dehydrorhamnose reductase